MTLSRRTTRARWLAGTAAIALTLGGMAKADGETIHIAFFGLAANNTFTQSMFEAAKATAAESGADVQFFDGKFNGTVQAKQIQDAITSEKFQGFLIMPNNGPSLTPYVKQAAEAGIKVGALQYPLGPDPVSVAPQLDEVTTQIVQDVTYSGKTLAEQVNLACAAYGTPCKVAALWGNRTLPTDATIIKGFSESIAPTVEVVAQQDAGYLTAQGVTVMGNILQAHPDVNVVVTNGDQMAIGAQKAVEALGKEVGDTEGKIAIVGHGATVEAVEAIKAGAWQSSLTIVPRTMSATATRIIIDAINGKEPTPDQRSIDQSILSPIGPVATPESLGKDASFTGEYSG